MSTKHIKHTKSKADLYGVPVRIDPSTHRVLRVIAAELGITMKATLAQLVAAAAKNRRPALSHE